MSIFDTILLISWAGFVFYGLFFGFIRMIGNFIGMIVGIFLASRFYVDFYESFDFLFGSYEGLGKIASFIILYGLISKLVSFGFAVAEKIFNLLTIIPFLKSFNKLGGAILGFFLGGVILGLVLYLGSKYFIIDSLLGASLVNSQITPILLFFAKLVEPLLPEALKVMKSLI
ncbi:MAG: CvpA family protein [Patescibacteria group bacterium]|jgi:uncharacterized membrane protein required for colicin V production|nr:CvpA family protein [Patescibacteria group bacterium]